MRSAWRIIGIIGAVCWAGARLLPRAMEGEGAGREGPALRADATSAETSVPLPDWAPKNPSPEFLRAAKVLKPLPQEREARLASRHPEVAAHMIHYNRVLVPTYELFGTLSDQQVQHFRSTHEIRIPVKSLTRPQRTALNNWFETWRKEMKDNEFTPDWLVILYREGAKEDLSNVDVGFEIQGNHYVHIKFWIRQAGGKVKTWSNSVAFI